MTDFHKYDLAEITQRYDLTSHPLLEIISHFGDSALYWIAGGAVRQFMQNLPITTDIDFFFTSEDSYIKFCKRHNPLETGVSTKNHTTFQAKIGESQYKIQAIKIDYYNDVEACLDSFDFTICQFGVMEGKLYTGKYSLWDLARKRLALHKLTYGAATVRRLLKYSKQGFTACQGCIQAILEAVGNDPEVIRSDVQYVD